MKFYQALLAAMVPVMARGDGIDFYTEDMPSPTGPINKDAEGAVETCLVTKDMPIKMANNNGQVPNYCNFQSYNDYAKCCTMSHDIHIK